MIDVKRLVVFAILMETNEGILGKAPDYIDEKYTGCQFLEHPEQMLDPTNRAKYLRWCERWIAKH